ncbi:MAG: hypothetical protein HQL51_05005 [Magnetococcales bacterium]|nr:hypothetical protein [Magnetococcales bacterium]
MSESGTIHRIALEEVRNRLRSAFLLAMVSLALGWGIFALPPMHATLERRQWLWGICFVLLALNLAGGWMLHLWMRRTRHQEIKIEAERLLLRNPRTRREESIPLERVAAMVVHRRGEEVVWLRLEFQSGGSLRLQGYDDMILLSETMTRRLGSQRVREG